MRGSGSCASRPARRSRDGNRCASKPLRTPRLRGTSCAAARKVLRQPRAIIG
ncbi:hypothetical protein I552_6010 [Mycobacterium xenopi 3993]|nr:hypothetical protein I552_6010 [Mycobacterium xenopi 3993]